MNRKKMLWGMFALVVFLVGCSNANTETEYYIIENNKKTYYEDDKFIINTLDLDSILENTVKSLNEIKDGKRDLSFIKEIEATELKNNVKHIAFMQLIPGESELKITRAKVVSFEITALQYDKDQNLIKVFIRTLTDEKQKDGFITVSNNQTYIYKSENNKLLLTEYNLSQYLR